MARPSKYTPEDWMLCAPLPPARAKLVGEVCAGASINLVLLAPSDITREESERVAHGA